MTQPNAGTPPRLVVGSRAAGRGIDRRDVDIVMTEDGREIARYDSRRFGESHARIFTWGRDRAHATGIAELADDWEVVVHRGGTPPFTSTTHSVMRDGDALFVGGSAEEVAAWKAGWRHALKERGLLTAKGRLRQTG